MPTFVEAGIVLAAGAGSVVTIGNFDGVHLGHRQLLVGAVAEAATRGLPSIAVTFEPHPATWFRGTPPEEFRIQSPEERDRELLRCGADHVAVLRFDEALAGLSPEEFVNEVLCGELGARGVHIGHDFTFGHRRAGDVARLRALGSAVGCTVTEHPQRLVGGLPASSTRLRAALRAGDLTEFEAVAGRPYAIGGLVGSGAGRGRTIGVPTINQYPADRLLPPKGVYVTRIRLGEDRARPGISNLGIRPTFTGDPRVSLETHVLDGAAIEPAAVAEVTFLRYLRPEQRFDSTEALVAQIGRDIAEARIGVAAPGDEAQARATSSSSDSGAP